ncbi:MAG: hypothetical protein ICV68_00235 [Pyrinomonadaceae bacterium]|nr:hypothetical protein [Pyrinomonadaceae bacterium]
MKQRRRILLLPLMAGALMLILNLVPSVEQVAAQKSRNQEYKKWEYCAVTNAYLAVTGESADKYVGRASICYFQLSGCRREEVRFELIYADFLREAGANPNPNYNRYAAGVRAAESALSKAIAQLGEDGWEMVGETPIDFVNNAESNMRNKAIYFKRPK